MNELQTILADTVTRLFTDRLTPELRESAEKGVWPAGLWQQVEENGLTLPQIPEARGGGGGTWQDAYVVVSAAGRTAAVGAGGDGSRGGAGPCLGGAGFGARCSSGRLTLRLRSASYNALGLPSGYDLRP